MTRLGRFIRKTSIDELPQFWNVFIGEMKYERWQRRRLSMKPGITCIWQVSGRNNVDFKTWMQQDLQYIDNWSLLLDVKLLLRRCRWCCWGWGRSRRRLRSGAPSSAASLTT
ncbi:MAG: sugar transferase [Deltaproteobacteria bacterium]|nr:sugar transferase [Deltaproteobacteria bacterium]